MRECIEYLTNKFSSLNGIICDGHNMRNGLEEAKLEAGMNGSCCSSHKRVDDNGLDYNCDQKCRRIEEFLKRRSHLFSD
jgi:hypothetical protein